MKEKFQKTGEERELSREPQSGDGAYEKRGYLDEEFRLFHLTGWIPREIAYHYHDFDKILLLLSGEVEYIIEGRSYRLLPGDIVLVGHHALHKPVVSEGSAYERIILYLSPHYVETFREGAGGCDLRRCFTAAKEHHSDVLRAVSPQRSLLYESIRRLERACQDEGYGKELYCRLLFLEFLIHLNRASLGSQMEYVDTSPGNEKILEIMRCISEDPGADYTIDGLASRFYLSKYHMMRLFKQETGYTINNYINEKRLLTARELLSRNVNVTEACFQSGFRNYSAFLRAYKKAFGETPRAGRRPPAMAQGGSLSCKNGTFSSEEATSPSEIH